jgi:hypothetical protein
MTGVSLTLADVTALEATCAAACARLVPDAVPIAEVDALHDALARCERLLGGARMRLARRIDEAGGWQRAGAKSAAHHLARTTGTSVARANATIAASKRLAALPATDAAVRTGSLSIEQAAAVADGAEANPAAEPRLLAMCARRSLGELQEEASRAKAAADTDAEARRTRIRASRYLRHQRTADGAGQISYRSTLEEAAEVMALLGPFVDEVFHRARRAGVHDRPEQYAADGLLAMARAAAAGRRSANAVTDEQGDLVLEPAKAAPAPAKLVFRVDWPAFQRGFPIDGEQCELAGVGPVPVSVIDEMLRSGDPFLAAVVTVGKDVVNVAHLGRKARAVQATALQWRDPLCAREGCNQAWHLDIDHREDWATTHVTLKLDHLCPHDHWLKTVKGWALVPGVGKRPMVPPDDPRHPKNQIVEDRGPPDPHLFDDAAFVGSGHEE